MHCNEPKSQAESYCNREAQAPDRRGNVTEQKSERDVGCGIQRSDKGCAPCWHEESREVQVIPGAIQDACVDQQFPSVCVCVHSCVVLWPMQLFTNGQWWSNLACLQSHHSLSKPFKLSSQTYENRTAGTIRTKRTTCRNARRKATRGDNAGYWYW